MRTTSCVLFLFLAACGSSDAPPTAGSAAPKSSAKSASSGAAATSAKPADTAAAADAKPADAAAGAPADPLDDTGKPQASCDNAKKGGSCTEHYALGLGEDSAKTRCEADGKWTKGGSCPKEDRVAVCRTGQDRMIYYKSVIAPGNGIPEIKGLCEVLPEGKFAEIKK